MTRSRKKHKSFPEESEKSKVNSQSRRIKELENEIKRLKSELKTLNKAFEKSATFMSDEAKLLTTEELIKAAEKNQTLKQAKTQYLDKQEEEKRQREEVRKKWDTWNRSRKKSEE